MQVGHITNYNTPMLLVKTLTLSCVMPQNQQSHIDHAHVTVNHVTVNGETFDCDLDPTNLSATQPHLVAYNAAKLASDRHCLLTNFANFSKSMPT